MNVIISKPLIMVIITYRTFTVHILLYIFFLLTPSRCVIQYKYQLKDYSIQLEQTNNFFQSTNLATCFGSLSHHQANSQNYTEGTFSRCARCTITNVYKSMTMKGINDCLVASIIL